MHKDSIKNVIILASSLCAVCAFLVSAPAVLLKDMQDENAKLSMQRNVLVAAGVPGAESLSGPAVREAFKQVDVIAFDFATGQALSDADLPKGFDPSSYEVGKASKDPKLSKAIPPAQDDNGQVQRRPLYGVVYQTKKDGKLDKLILPVKGLGLWGPMFGFLALEKDLNTVAGLKYYDHKETPGLGGEVDNNSWRAKWTGKEVFEGSAVALQVIKGTVVPDMPGVEHKVDGLSGATITCNGVNSTLKYWLGQNGYGPLLDRMKAELAGVR